MASNCIDKKIKRYQQKAISKDYQLYTNQQNSEVINQYSERVTFVERLMALQDIKMNMTVYFADHGELPKNTRLFVEEYGKEIVESNSYFKEISIGGDSQIRAFLASPYKEGEFLSLQPEIISNHSLSIKWNCETNVSQSKVGSTRTCKSTI